MLNKIIHLSLNNRVAVVILSALILIAGLVTLTRMEIDIFPDLNAPTVVVMTEAPGIAADEVETLVTYPIETAVNGATGIRRVRSSSTAGFSVVWVEFDWDTDIYRARQIVAERLDNLGDRLPEGIRPVLGPQSSILGEMLIVGMTADSTSLLELRRLADKVIAPRLLAQGGVSQVSVIGGDAPEYRIQFDPDRMRAFGITLDQLRDAVTGLNDNAAGGVIYDFGNEYIVKARLNTASADELAATVVSTDPTGAPVTVADVATVAVAGERPRLGCASVEAKPAVIITVTKQPAEGTIELTAKIDRELADLAASLPEDVEIHTDIFRQSDFIDASVSNLQEALLEGALFVIIVLFFFLMNLRTTLISVVALPVSIIVTVLLLNVLGYSINTMSLGGIAIAIGSLVDDAIVDVENVYKRLRQNAALPAASRLRTLEVVLEASKEVRMPIFNSSLIIIASFLPLFFLSGIEGRMLQPLGVSFILALVASTIVALTLTPVLCSFLLGNVSGDEKLSAEPAPARMLRRAYERSLSAAMKHKKVVLGAVAMLFVVSLGLFFTLGRSFLPSFNEGSFTINVSTLPGISLEESDKIGREAERLIMMTPEIRTVARKTGRAELDEHSLGVNVSEIEAPYTLTDRSRQEIARELRQRLATLPGAVVELGQPISHRIDAMLSGTEAQIAIKIFGPDLNALFATGGQIRNILSEVPGVVDINIEQQVERPEIIITPRRELLARYGITPASFASTLRTVMAGDKVSRVYLDGNSYDVTLVADDVHRDNIDAIRRITLDTPSGTPVALEDVAEVRSTTGPNSISRENVKRRLVVSANLDGKRDLRTTIGEIQHEISEKVTLPEDYYIVYGGQFESEARASRTLLLASLGALLLILMLLYGEFRSWTQSLVILLNMPLALIGGVLILKLTGGELNIPAIIGFISLMGITTRNGMLLINRYNALAAQGVSLSERIRTGSSDRLLPIVMTALTSALALIPLAVNADSPGNEIQSPMAIVILGGLVSATALNVYVVPAIYQIIETRKSRKDNE